MNPILKLFDPDFVREFFRDRLLPRYPGFTALGPIEIEPIKDNVWESSYHVVILFKTTILGGAGRKKTLPIYASAHSSEPRKNVYDGMKFLWQNGFYRGKLTMPRPLFYSNQFKATFYRGVKGEHLYNFIRRQERDEVEAIVPKAAGLFAKLHSLPTAGARNFNRKNSRIDTVIPGISHINFRIKKDYPGYQYLFKKVFNILAEAEKEFFGSTRVRWLVHGDAHPENVIKVSRQKVALIDFTDLCLADFARDLGTFLQQLEFMLERKIGDPGYTARIKDSFLNSYQENAKIKLDEAIRARITNYYHWTAMRTATMFLLKDKPEPERAKPLLNRVAAAFKIKVNE